MSDDVATLRLLLRMQVQKSRREREAQDRLDDAKLALVESWRLPDTSEPVMQIRERIAQANRDLALARCLNALSWKIVEEAVATTPALYPEPFITQQESAA